MILYGRIYETESLKVACKIVKKSKCLKYRKNINDSRELICR